MCQVPSAPTVPNVQSPFVRTLYEKFATDASTRVCHITVHTKYDYDERQWLLEDIYTR